MPRPHDHAQPAPEPGPSPGPDADLFPDPRPWPADPSLPALRPLGWAGLLLPVPIGWKLFEVDGDGLEGRLGMADQHHPRLRIAWARVSRSRFDAEKFIRRRFRRTKSRSRSPSAGGPEPRAIAHEQLKPLWLLSDDDAQLDRAVGYCPATARVIDIIYHRDQPREDRAFLAAMLPRLRDQPLTGPARWSFFDVSFVSPPGFLLARATLNLGDMRVEFRSGARPTSGPTLGIRHVYPASLALTRQPLEDWLRTWARDFRQFYRPRFAGLFRPPPPAVTSVESSRGPGLALDLRFRGVYRAVLWRAPSLMRLWFVHDAAANRLLGVWSTDARHAGDAIEGRLREALAHAHWAEPPQRPDEPR